MSDSLTARFRWTADEALKGYHWHLRQRPILVRLFPWLVTAVTFFYGVEAAARFGITGIPPIVGAVLAVLFFLCFRPWILRRQYAERSDHGAEIEWQVDPERIQIRDPETTTAFTWAALAKVVRTPEGFLFYPNLQIFHWLPRHALAGEEDIQRLTDLIGSRARTFREVA